MRMEQAFALLEYVAGTSKNIGAIGDGYPVTQQSLREAFKIIAEACADSSRLTLMETLGKIAENNELARVWAISAHREFTLREALDLYAENVVRPPNSQEVDRG